LKKILLSGLILTMVVPVTVFAVEEYVNIGPVKLQVAINQFPGKNYWVETLFEWDSSLIPPDYKSKVAQKEKAFHVTLLSIRASKMKPVLTPSLSGGLEVGCEIPITTWKKDWENAAGDTSVGKPPEYTEIEWDEIGELLEPEKEYTQLLEIKERLLVVPILGKLAYTIYGGTRLDMGLSFGAYIMNARITSVYTYTYVQSSGLYVAGDKVTTETSFSTTACSPGGEFSVDLYLPVAEKFFVGFSGRVGYIGRATIFWGEETTDYAQIEWPPAAKELTTLKKLFEAGGFSYGGGFSLNFFL